jgi:DnaA family protein
MQLTLDIGLPHGPCLDDFSVGANGDLLDHLRLWLGPARASVRQRSPVPTYIWGASGLGKSHVLRGIQNQLLAQGESVGWLDPAVNDSSVFDPSWSAVLLDGVQAFDSQQQQLAFQWFIEAQTQGKAVIAAGTLPPADLQLRDDLRSRLGWGHVFALKPLDDQGRREVLQSNAHARGLKLGTEVADYLLTRLSRDLGSLIHVLDRIDQFALQSKRAITIPMIKDMMDSQTDASP